MNLRITDHALLRWMERFHGIDVEGFRALMHQEALDALEEYEGREIPGEAGFVVLGDTIVTALAEGQTANAFKYRRGVVVPRASGASI